MEKQLSKTGRYIKDSIKNYNDLSDVSASSILPNALSWEDVVNLEGDFWKSISGINVSIVSPEQIPILTKRKCIELFQLCERAEEEIEMVKLEMQNTISSFTKNVERYREAMQSLGEGILEDGWRAKLKEKIFLLNERIGKLSTIFSKYVVAEVSIPEDQFEDELSTDESDVE